MKLLTFQLLLIILLFVSCKEPLITVSDQCNKDEVVLVDTMLFGCKVDGQPWKFQALGLLDIIVNPAIGNGIRSDGLFIVSGDRKLESPCPTIHQRMSIVKSNAELGNNNLGSSSYFWDLNNGCVSYKIDTLAANNLFFTTLDSINNKVSGTFYFQAISESCEDTIKITEGRFNLNL